MRAARIAELRFLATTDSHVDVGGLEEVLDEAERLQYELENERAIFVEQAERTLEIAGKLNKAVEALREIAAVPYDAMAVECWRLAEVCLRELGEGR